MGAPGFRGEDEIEEAEEESSHLQPEDATYAAEGAEESAEASACRTGDFLRLDGGFADLRLSGNVAAG